MVQHVKGATYQSKFIRCSSNRVVIPFHAWRVRITWLAEAVETLVVVSTLLLDDFYDRFFWWHSPTNVSSEGVFNKALVLLSICNAGSDVAKVRFRAVSSLDCYSAQKADRTDHVNFKKPNTKAYIRDNFYIAVSGLKSKQQLYQIYQPLYLSALHLASFHHSQCHHGTHWVLVVCMALIYLSVVNLVY